MLTRLHENMSPSTSGVLQTHCPDRDELVDRFDRMLALYTPAQAECLLLQEIEDRGVVLDA